LRLKVWGVRAPLKTVKWQEVTSTLITLIQH
jgi:hypothetical protein